MRALVLAALAGAAAAAAHSTLPAGGSGCVAELTTLCVLRHACLERTAPGVASLVQYGVPAGAPAAVPARPIRWANVTASASPRAYADAAAGARAAFRGTTVLSAMYQMHLPHYLEDALATLPLFLRPADFGLDGPPVRNPFLLGHVSPPGFYKYDYHRAFQSLFSKAENNWEGGVLADDALLGANAFDAFWAKHVLPGDDVRPTGDRLCFDALAFNLDGRWQHSIADSRFLRARAAADWGLAFSHDDVCILQRRDHRAIANVDAVAAMLERRTGKRARVFMMEARPPHAQATLMSTCGVLVTPHGANEVNLMFVPDGALVIELVPAVSHYVIDYFKKLATSTGLRTHHVVIPIERMHNDNGCLAIHAGTPWAACYHGVGECHWCYKQSNMTLIEADFEGVL